MCFDNKSIGTIIKRKNIAWLISAYRLRQLKIIMKHVIQSLKPKIDATLMAVPQRFFTQQKLNVYESREEVAEK